MQFVLIVLLLSLTTTAQILPSEMWHNGTAYLTDGNKYTGEVKYDLENNLIQLRTSNDKLFSFSSQKIEYFKIYDNYFRGIRTFYSLPYDFNGDGYSPNIFFEVLWEDSVSLLCREYIIQQNPNNFNQISFRTLSFKYFILDQKEGLFPYSGRRKELLLMIDREYTQDLKQYIKKNNLKTNLRGDLTDIFEYFNELIYD